MRILFVAFPNSVHTARWISQLTDLGWDIHLAPSSNYPLHPFLQGNVTFHGWGVQVNWLRRLVVNFLRKWPHPRGSGHARRLMERIDSGMSPRRLAATIRKVKPDVVHSLEIQHAAYLTLHARQLIGEPFPTWIVSNWGSDIYLFGRLARHRAQIRQVMTLCDVVFSECARDVHLAQAFGNNNADFPVVPAAGGFDLDKWLPLRQPGPTSDRRLIVLKGYQHWVGRALTGLRAIELCADVLQGYRVVLTLTSQDVPLAAELLTEKTGIPIEVSPFVDYEAIMRRYGAARVYMGLSISDGISQSLLEAMVMGAVPIQSCTACANEWIEDGKSGFIVPPEDPHVIAAALRRAVTDDAFTEQAVAINDETVRRRLAYGHIKKQVVEMYATVMGDAARNARNDRSDRPE